MPTNTFVTRLSRGAVASIAVGCLVPESHTTATDTAVAIQAVAMPEQTFTAETADRSESGDSLIVTLPESQREWTKQMDREFRQLALGEAKGNLTAEQLARLEALSLLRDRISNPRPAEEVLLQLKRDSLLEKISDTLREYVEFQESANKARLAAD